MKVTAYCFSCNDVELAPYYVRLFNEFCDKIILCDAGSTDGTVEVFASCPKVEIRQRENSMMDEGHLLEDKNNFYKEQRGESDFVIVGDLDEFVYHPKGMRKYLEGCKEKGETLLSSQGYEMVSSAFPTGDKQIYEIVNTGVASPPYLRIWHYSKKIIFDPQIDINFQMGCHDVKPEGPIVNSEEKFKLLHYRYLSLGYVMDKYEFNNSRLSQRAIEKQWTTYYAWPMERVKETFTYLTMKGKNVLG